MWKRRAKGRPAVPVVAGLDPDIFIGLGALAFHGHRPMAETAIGEQFRRIGVGNHDGAVGGGGALGGPPRGRIRACPAIDDQAFAAGTHLEAERAGMGSPIKPRWRRRAGIEDNQRALRAQALEAQMRRRGGWFALGFAGRKNSVDLRAVRLAAVVEQGKAAIAMTKEAEHRSNAVDGVMKGLGRADAAFAQEDAQLDKNTQRFELGGRRTFDMSAVNQDLASKLTLEQGQTTGEEGVPPGQAGPGKDQSLDREEAGDSVGPGAGAARETEELPGETAAETKVEIGVGVEKIVSAQP